MMEGLSKLATAEFRIGVLSSTISSVTPTPISRAQNLMTQQ